MKATEVLRLAHSLMANNASGRNLFNEGWSFAFNSSKRIIGLCHYGKKEINYSSHFLNQSDEDIKDTILHEIAHALVGPGFGHGYQWQRMAVKVGAKPIRCKKTNEETKQHLQSVSKYTYFCPNCNNATSVHRRLKGNRSCGKCHPVYNPVYQLKMIQNY